MYMLLMCMMLSQEIPTETCFVVYPEHLNHNEILSGKKILEEMDKASGIATRRWLYATELDYAVTSKIEMEFLAPGHLKDLVIVRSRIDRAEDRHIIVDTVVEREGKGGMRSVLAKGKLTFVGVKKK